MFIRASLLCALLAPFTAMAANPPNFDALTSAIKAGDYKNITSVLVLILVSLTVTRLWRRHLPMGAKFYSLTFLTAWSGQLILEGQPQLAAWQPMIGSVYQGAAYAAIVASVGIVWWIFTRTDRRIERLNLAPALAFCLTLAVFILVAA